jgi:hypothetical protein
MRQQLFLKKKDGCLICVNKPFSKRKMAAKLRQQNSSPALGLVWQNHLQAVTCKFPKCTSKCTSSPLNLQVFAMSFTSEIYKCICEWNYKCILSVLISIRMSLFSNFNSKIRIQIVAIKGILKSCISLCIFRLICLV